MLRLLRTKHTSCASFLKHCENTNASPESTVFRGTLYEMACREILGSLKCSVAHVGGANDRGVDLIGKWDLSAYKTDKRPPKSLSKKGIFQVDVLVQCKNTKTLSSRVVREIAGAYGCYVRARNSSTFFLLMASAPLSEESRRTLDVLHFPAIYLRVRPMVMRDMERAYDVEMYEKAFLESWYVNGRAREMMRGMDVQRVRQLIEKS